MDNTYKDIQIDTPHLIILEYDETFVTKDGKFSYLIGKKTDSNDVKLQKKSIDSGKVETTTLGYAWLEIQQSINKNQSIKNAYMDYLSRHYKLGCTKHKEYKGYKYLIEFIKPLMVDKISKNNILNVQMKNDD